MALTEETIRSLGPKKTVIDGDVVETHSLYELMQWDKHVAKTEAAVNNGNPMLRIWRSKFTIPGPVSRMDPPECPS